MSVVQRRARSRSGHSIANRPSEHRSTVCTTDILSVESSSRNSRIRRHKSDQCLARKSDQCLARIWFWRRRASSPKVRMAQNYRWRRGRHARDGQDVCRTTRRGVVRIRGGPWCGREARRAPPRDSERTISAWHKWLKEWPGGMRISHGLRGSRRLARRDRKVAGTLSEVEKWLARCPLFPA